MNPLDVVLVEFTSDAGSLVTIPASQIRSLSEKEKGVVALFMGSDWAKIPLSGTYAENLAIWKAAIAPLTTPHLVLPEHQVCAECHTGFLVQDTLRVLPGGKLVHAGCL